MPDYQGYGLHLRSDIPLPELIPTAPRPRRADISFRFVGSSLAPRPRRWDIELQLDNGRVWLRCARGSRGYLVRFDEADWLVSRDGRRVECLRASIDRGSPTLRHIALDQVVPLALKLRGEEVLHAAAIRAGAGVIALVGPGGSGKSTLAAAVLRHGGAVIADDCLRIATRSGGVDVWPAYPGVRLWADAFEAITGETVQADRRPLKRRWSPPVGRAPFTRQRLPLLKMYRLVRTSTRATRVGPRLRPRDVFVELAASTFRFDAGDRAMLRREFALWDHIARTVPMQTLFVAHDFSAAGARALIRDESA